MVGTTQLQAKFALITLRHPIFGGYWARDTGMYTHSHTHVGSRGHVVWLRAAPGRPVLQ